MQTHLTNFGRIDIYDGSDAADREAIRARLAALCPPPLTPAQEAAKAARKARLAELAAMPRDKAAASIFAEIDAAFAAGSRPAAKSEAA